MSLKGSLKTTLWLALLALILKRLSTTCADWDLWAYLSFGRLYWLSEGFPYRDVFAYTPTLDPWVNHEWLTGVIFYHLYRSLGASGLQILKYGFGLATLGLIYATARRRGAYQGAAGVLLAILATWITPFYEPLRAQVFTFFCFALVLLIIEQARLSGRFKGLYVLPPLLVLWCNLHGGFLSGLGLLFLYTLGEFLARRPWRPYAASLLLGSMVTLVNPYGLKYYYFLGQVTTRTYPKISEWLSLISAYQTGHKPGLALFTLALLLFVALSAMWQSRWRELTPSLALVVTLFLGFRQHRHLILFLLLLTAYLPVNFKIYLDYLYTHPGLQRLCNHKAVKIATLGCLVVIISILGYAIVNKSPLSLKIPHQPSKVWGNRYYPVGAVNFIKNAGLTGNIAAVYHWGNFLAWELHPQCRVAFDGRFDTVFPREMEELFGAFQDALPGWSEFLKRYPPDLVLLNTGAKLVPLLKQEPGWQVAYADAGCVLFKAVPPNLNSP